MSSWKIYIEWQIHYAALLEYYKENATCNIPTTHTYECDLAGIVDDDGNSYHYKGNLGKWLNNQRQAYKCQDGSKLASGHEAQLQLLVDEGYKSL